MTLYQGNNIQTIIEGEAEAVNEKGVKVRGTWYNLTKKQQGEGFVLPGAGMHIRIAFHEWTAPSGTVMFFLDEWTWDNKEANEQVGDGYSAPPGVYHPEREPKPSPDARPVVTRLACLNSAIATMKAAGLNLGVQAMEEEILGLAERYVAWATWGGGDASPK